MIVDRISISDFDEQKLKEVLAQKTQHRVNWIDRYRDQLGGEDPSIDGVELCWEKCQDKVVLQYGCVSTWVGIDGHKKSSVITQILTFASRQVVVGMASLEMKVRSQLTLMIQQATGVSKPSSELENQFLDWGRDRILLYDHVGDVEPIQVYALVTKMAKDYRAKLIVIDCLQMIGGVGEKTETERQIMQMFVQLSKAFNIHIAVIHHTRKPSQGGDEYVPTRFDALGSTSISQLSSILCIVWSDKKKDRLKEIPEEDLTETQQEYLSRPDTRIIVAKNRHLPWEGVIGLWLHNRQFIPSDAGRPLFFNEDFSS